jgi:aldose 1-epimerase
MELDPRPGAPRSGAMAPIAPGPLITIAKGPLSVEIAPAAGGRIAQIVRDGVEWLVGHDEQASAMIAWGSYPMVPWAGRIRRGRFDFQDRSYQLPLNLGEHAIHGVAFAMPWRVDAHSRNHAELSLALPDDERWPFGGTSRQRFEVGENRLRMTLSVTAGERAMPAAIGWHPWFRKPERIGFSPTLAYPRDEEGIATRPLAQAPPGPWDDCFVNEDPVQIHRCGQSLTLTSDCTHWVVYDETGHATCIEPQSGPPDGFNLEPMRLAPGASIDAWFLFEWR